MLDTKDNLLERVNKTMEWMQVAYLSSWLDNIKGKDLSSPIGNNALDIEQHNVTRHVGRQDLWNEELSDWFDWLGHIMIVVSNASEH